MEFINIAIVIKFFGGALVAANPCYFWPGAEYHGNFCYTFVRSKLNWTSAAASCRSLNPNGKLAEPPSEDHMLFIRQMTVAEFRDIGMQTVWIGGVRDNVTKQLVWSSTGQAITTTSWGYQQPNSVNKGENCVGLEQNAVNDVHDFQCNLLKYHMCETFVGDPCEQTYPGGRFWDGYCFKFHEEPAFWSDARIRCAQEDATVAEPHTESLFKFVQSMARRQAGIRVVVPKKPEIIDMEVNKWTLTGQTEIRFAVQACGAASLILSPVNYVKSNSTAYYEIILGSNKNKTVTLRSCVKWPLSCTKIQEVNTTAGLMCNDFREYLINWSGNQIHIEAEFKGVIFDFRFINPMMAINFLTLAMGDLSGVWLFSKGGGEDQILLGAKYLDGENIYRWMSTGEVVNLTGWAQGQPNATSGQNSLGVMGPAKRLGNIEENQSKRFICQKSASTHAYLVVVPGGGVRSYEIIQFHVTTNKSYHVYISVVENLPASTIPSKRNIDGGLSRSTSFLFKIDLRLEMRSSGVHGGYVSLMATDQVTVVMFCTTIIEGVSTLVPPVSALSTSYYISGASNGPTMVSITATSSSTTVIVTFPVRNDTKMMFAGERFVYDQPVSVRGTLNKYETLFLRNKGDLAGSFIQTSEPVLVMTGSFGQTDEFNDLTLDFEIPISSMGSAYVTIPSFPLLSTELDYFRVVAIFPQTLIKIFGTDGYIKNVLLPFVGESVDIAIPRNGFYSLTSSVVFHVIKTREALNKTKSVCTMSLLPSSLWKTSYDFHLPPKGTSNTSVYVAVILQTGSISNVLANARSFADSFSCSAVEETSLSGCYFTVRPNNNNNNDIIHVWDNQTFAAYMLVYDDDMMMCHALGTEAVKTNVTAVYEPDLRRRPSSECTSSFHNVSKDVTDEKLEAMKKLVLDVRRTSRYKRTLISVPDQRVSSATVGYLGIVVVGLVVALLVLSDLHRFFKLLAIP